MSLKPSLLATLIVASLSASQFTSAANVDLRIIETTDLHANMLDYDYYKDMPSDKLGLARTADLIVKAREQAKNSVLVDNGDLIQGSPMGDYIASKGLKKGEIHPVYKAMNLLNYDAATVGNHEFNYGLEFMNTALAGANFPYVNANVIDKATGKPYFTPYLIKDYQFTDDKGEQQAMKIGYIGFVPPQILTWDKKHLDGKLEVKDITKTARALIPQMKAEGADIIIALMHSGLSKEEYQPSAENSVAYISKIDGIDAIAFGHAHGVFPGKAFADVANVDLEKGTINGIPAVMPGSWGSHLGIIDLNLNNDSGKWLVTDARAEALPIYDNQSKSAVANTHSEIVTALEEDHKNTREYVNQPIGKAADNMYSFLALVQDDPTIQIVNLAQQDYVKNFVKGNPKLEKLPVLSAAAPFKTGGRKNDPTSYTEVEAGQLSFRNAADLYLYPNTLVALKINGAQVKEWLECSAGQFKQIDPTKSETQSLIDWDGFRTYNFDVIDGVNYQIDVTQPARYDGDCKLINPNSHRISELTFNGKAINPKQEFLIATNNYRAFGDKFPGTDGSQLAFVSPDENRTILADYIRRVSKEKGEVKPQADNNWRFKAIPNNKAEIVFETSPSEKAEAFIQQKAQYPMKKVGQDDIGFAIYQIDLTK